VSIRSFLGIPDQHAVTGDTETVRKVIEALDKLDLKFPTVDKEARAALDAARAQLESER